jgi:hypothetical protein
MEGPWDGTPEGQQRNATFISVRAAMASADHQIEILLEIIKEAIEALEEDVGSLEVIPIARAVGILRGAINE